MILVNSKFAIFPSRFEAFNMIFLEMMQILLLCLYGTVTHLTPQNKFLEDHRFQKLVIFLAPFNHGVGKEKLPV